MAFILFKDSTYQVAELISMIRRGSLALPDIQRPFVWDHTKVRDLFDSMYRGFPVGHLLFWETGTGDNTRTIGTGQDGGTVPSQLIVDGQQRLTSLFAVIGGQQVITKEYRPVSIRIAFRPSDGTFRVADAAVARDPEFIADISVLWQDGRRGHVRRFFDRLAEKRPLDDSERDRLEDAIDRVHDLATYTFRAVVLSPEANEEEVADVFVRINSEGVSLSQADFILTLLSVFQDKERKRLEDFARSARQPPTDQASSFNWHIQPDPAQLLRVTIAVAFRRAVLKAVYALLRGKDITTGIVDPQRRSEQFALLQAAHDKALNLTNWHEFLTCLDRAGFRSRKMISSENAVLFTYALWLIGRYDYGVQISQLRELIARWFFMAHMTGRYSGTFETQVERDLGQLAELSPGDAAGFARMIDKIIADRLTNDFWTITLPNNLATSAAFSPSLLAYVAALNILDADVLLSRTKVRIRLDPAVLLVKGIERHHLFPRNHLKKHLGVKDSKQINQIANMALVEWSDNIAIGDKAPSEYWPEQTVDKGLSEDELAAHRYWHALPENWTSLSYRELLEQRRPLIATVVRDAYRKLADPAYHPVHSAPSAPAPTTTAVTHIGVSITDLLDEDLLTEGTVLTPAYGDHEATAIVQEDGRLTIGDEEFANPGSAARAVGAQGNGWQFWIADTPGGQRTLEQLRDQYLERRTQ